MLRRPSHLSSHRKWVSSGVAALALALSVASEAASPAIRSEVVRQNADIAYAGYVDSLMTAKAMSRAIDRLLAEPNAANLEAARQSWLAAREPYGQTEVYRFQNGPIDDLGESGGMHPGAGHEGRINGWPLDEAFIDYVAPKVDGNATNPDHPPINLIADTGFVITARNLANMHELNGNEANVATGYHAIEFLLWGQDLNIGETSWDGQSSRDASPGQRPASDFVDGPACTSGVGTLGDPAICQRRGRYLAAAAELLINDLGRIVDAWDPQGLNNYYHEFTDPGRIDGSLLKILVGMGSLSYGELAGERILVALSGQSQEDEHSCFSDNTHRDIYLNALGVQNGYLGDYRRIDGSQMAGPGIVDLLAVKDRSLEQALTQHVAASVKSAQMLVDKAESEPRVPFDRMIEQFPGVDPQGKPVANANFDNNMLVNDVALSLQRQAAAIEKAIFVLLGPVDYRIEDSSAFSMQPE